MEDVGLRKAAEIIFKVEGIPEEDIDRSTKINRCLFLAYRLLMKGVYGVVMGEEVETAGDMAELLQ